MVAYQATVSVPPTNETKMGEYTGVSKQTGGWSAVEMLCL